MIDRGMGREALDAISEDEDAAAAIGINVMREKLRVTVDQRRAHRARRRDFAQYLMYLDPETVSGIARLAADRVRRDRRRHVRDARADGRRAAHDLAARGPARPAFAHQLHRRGQHRSTALLLILFIIFMPKGIVGTGTDWWRRMRTRTKLPLEVNEATSSV